MCKNLRIFSIITSIILALVMVSLQVVSVNAEQPDNDEAILIDSSENHYTPQYLQYLEDFENGDTAKYGGIIPRAIAPSYADEVNYFRTQSFFYDPRGEGRLTPIKNQGKLNTCWTFAANACLEAAATRISGQKQAFSEEHMRFILSNKLIDKNGDSNNVGYYLRNADDGGNSSMAFAYFTNWNEPILNRQNVSWQTPVLSTDVPNRISQSGLGWPQGMDARGSIHVTATEELQLIK